MGTRARRALAAWCACTLSVGAVAAGGAVGSATLVEAVSDPVAARGPGVDPDGRGPGTGAGAGATTTTAAAAGGAAEGGVGNSSSTEPPPGGDTTGATVGPPPAGGPTIEELLAHDRPPPDPVPNTGTPEDAGWTGVAGVARYSDGSTKPICILLSDRNGSHSSTRVTPGVPFSVAFPPRPAVSTWIAACDEGPHSGGIHTELTPTIAVRSDGPTPVDWIVTRNEVTVDLRVHTADGRPIAGICAHIGNGTYRTDGGGRVVVPGVHLSVAAVQVGYGCAQGGNWLSGLGQPTFLTGPPESVVRHTETLPADPTDSFGTASATFASGVVEFVRTTVQPGEPTPSCAPGPLTGSTWHEAVGEWVSAFLRPGSGDGGSVVAVWEGTGLHDLREVACARSPAGFPFHSIPPNPSGLPRYVQYADTGTPDVADYTIDVT